MKNLFRANIIALICALLVACGQISQLSPTSSATLSPSDTPIPSQTATPQMEALPTLDTNALPTFVIPDGTNIPFPTQDPKIPTLIPTIDPNLVPDLLRKAISIQTLNGVNGHNIQKITGWDYGLSQSNTCNSYQWLDSNHLLLYPRTGQEMVSALGSMVQKDLSSQLVVVNLISGSLWLAPIDNSSNTDTSKQNCDSVYWSKEQGVIIVQKLYENPSSDIHKPTIFTYTFDGKDISHYLGKILDVSPSGTKILTEDYTWIDLATGKTVNFAWSEDVYPYSTLADLSVVQPTWSSDEHQVFTCCYHYGNAHTGKFHDFPFYNAFIGTWVLGDSYLLLQYHNYWGSNPGFIPLYNPITNTTLNLNQLAGLPNGITCPESSVSPDREAVWIMCYGTDYLVDLANYKFKDFPGYSQVGIGWSGDGKYAVIDNWDLGKNSLSILAVTNKTLTPFPVYPINGPIWHPFDHTMAYLTNHNQMLNILDVQDLSIKEHELPSTFDNFIWSPDGNHIALVTADGSLWQADYPKMENIEQLTKPMPMVDIQWSPDNTSISFISGKDIYVVDTVK